MDEVATRSDPEVPFEGSTVSCDRDCSHAGRRHPGLWSRDQVVTNGPNRKLAVKAKAYRHALAVSMLALAVNALGAPRKR